MSLLLLLLAGLALAGPAPRPRPAGAPALQRVPLLRSGRPLPLALPGSPHYRGAPAARPAPERLQSLIAEVQPVYARELPLAEARVSESLAGLGSVSARAKDPASAVNRLERAVDRFGAEVFDGASALENLWDAVGTRLALDDPSPAGVDRVVSALIAAKKRGTLEIVQINNLAGRPGMPYLEARHLEALRAAGIVVENRDYDSGLTMVAVYLRHGNGARGELQIMGKRVREFASAQHVAHDAFVRKPWDRGLDAAAADAVRPRLEAYERAARALSPERVTEYKAYLTAHYRRARLLELGRASPVPPLPHGLDPLLSADNLARLNADLRPPAPASRRRMVLPLAAAALAGAAAPVAWGAVGTMSLLSAAPLALAGAAALLALWALARPRPRSRAGILALALALGAAAHGARRELIEPVAAVAAPDRAVARLGPDFSALAEENLARTDEGRAILRGLSDRSGRLRLPAFYLARTEGYLGINSWPLDAVLLRRPEGWDGSPRALRRLAAEAAGTLVHELRHAEQSRRSPFSRGYWDAGQERELEAYWSEAVHVHELLGDDPSAAIAPDDLRHYRRVLDGEGDFYRDLLAFKESVWPVFSVEGYARLARRALPGDPGAARELLRLAAARAREYGLPEPSGAGF